MVFDFDRLFGSECGMADVVEVNESTFQAEVLESQQPVLVDFWATWCAPCRAIAPVIEELARDNAGRAKVVKVNVDQSQKLAYTYKVEYVPTLLVFKNGEVVAQFQGAVSDLKSKLQNALDSAA